MINRVHWVVRWVGLNFQFFVLLLVFHPHFIHQPAASAQQPQNPMQAWPCLFLLPIFAGCLPCAIMMSNPGGGGVTDLERGYGDVRPWRPPFHASPVVRKGPISSKRVSSQDPLLRKFWDFSLYSLNFCPNLSSQAPQNWEIFNSQALKFGNFQFTHFGRIYLENIPC